jgi:hypothetical protein
MDRIKIILGNTGIRHVLAITFFFRLIFRLFLARYFYGREDFFMSYDTICWSNAFDFLLETGKFTIDPNNANGYFSRMPLFSFYMGVFYLLLGKDWMLTYNVISWFQIFLDCMAVWLVYKTMINLTSSKIKAVVVSLLFGLYPFYLVWSPVAYTESLSVFLLILALYYSTSPGAHFRSYVFSGFALGLAVLLRPQLLLLVMLFPLAFFLPESGNVRKGFRFGMAFLMGFLLGFGPWPARNYFFHQRLVITQDISGSPNWYKDVMAFTKFMYAVQTDWNPQFDEIVAGKPVTYPQGALLSETDSIRLMKAFTLASSNSFGFSHWTGSWRPKLTENNPETDSVIAIFTELRAKIIREHPVHFWLWVPLGNLNKAIFKSSLNWKSTKGFNAILSTSMFLIRSLLILSGFFALIMLLSKPYGPTNHINWLAFLYFLLLYFIMCFGNANMLRNIEIRYFLHADLLLLIPLGLVIGAWFENKSGKSAVLP